MLLAHRCMKSLISACHDNQASVKSSIMLRSCCDCAHVAAEPDCCCLQLLSDQQCQALLTLHIW